MADSDYVYKTFKQISKDPFVPLEQREQDEKGYVDVNIDEYFFFKWLDSWIFTFYQQDEGRKYHFKKNFKDTDYLLCYQERLYEFLDNKELDPVIMNNIGNLISDLRFEETKDNFEDKKEYELRQQTFNNIISKINTSSSEYADDYFIEEFEIKTESKYKENSKIMMDLYKRVIYVAKCFDFEILKSHLRHTTDKEFKVAIKPLVDCELYYSSINTLIQEHPNILNYEEFISRYNIIHNLKSKKELEPLFTEIKGNKDAKRLIKNCNRNINYYMKKKRI